MPAAFPPYVAHFSLDNPERIVYKEPRCPIRIEFERRLVAANSLQKQPNAVSAARSAWCLGPSFGKTPPPSFCHAAGDMTGLH
jgi:hypothetical protein